MARSHPRGPGRDQVGAVPPPRGRTAAGRARSDPPRPGRPRATCNTRQTSPHRARQRHISMLPMLICTPGARGRGLWHVLQGCLRPPAAGTTQAARAHRHRAAPAADHSPPRPPPRPIHYEPNFGGALGSNVNRARPDHTTAQPAAQSAGDTTRLLAWSRERPSPKAQLTGRSSATIASMTPSSSGRPTVGRGICRCAERV